MIDFVEVFFDAIWKLFLIRWPGTSFPICIPFLGVAFCVITLRVVLSLVNVNLGSTVTSIPQKSNNTIRRLSQDKKSDRKGGR